MDTEIHHLFFARKLLCNKEKLLFFSGRILLLDKQDWITFGATWLTLDVFAIHMSLSPWVHWNMVLMISSNSELPFAFECFFLSLFSLSSATSKGLDRLHMWKKTS